MHLTYNIAGVSQWMFVASMIVFYSSYSTDFRGKRDHASMLQCIVCFVIMYCVVTVHCVVLTSSPS